MLHIGADLSSLFNTLETKIHSGLRAESFLQMIIVEC